MSTLPVAARAGRRHLVCGEVGRVIGGVLGFKVEEEGRFGWQKCIP